MDWKLLRKAYDLFVVFFVPFVQALQFEGKHNPEDADDQQSVRDHIAVSYTHLTLPTT